MYHDAIVEEIHKIREEYSRSFNHDLKALFADLQRQQAESEHKFVDLSKNRSSKTRWIKPLEASTVNVQDVDK
jgi:hypothetical protein